MTKDPVTPACLHSETSLLQGVALPIQILVVG